MSAMVFVGGVVAFALLLYLMVALFKPEVF